MSAPINKPCFVAGTPRYSGGPGTGEVSITRGGQQTACVWSGSLLTTAALTGAPGAIQSGGHVLLYSGAGRLNTVIAHQFFTSGVQVTFYDAGTPSLSGTSFSGQRIVGFVPPTTPGVLTVGSGNLQYVPTWSFKTDWDTPFSSGLCACAASGTPGFTVTFTPEVIEPAFGRAG